jgi:hypothetical protein
VVTCVPQHFHKAHIFIIVPHSSIPPLLLEHQCCSILLSSVPASYREWIHGFPDFVTNETLKAEYGYSTFLYQKHNPDLPNYVSSNRGCENSIYYKYIVDHYHDFPDLAIFVHAKPGEHNSDQWLNYIKCIRPNATYMSLNVEKQVCREVFNGYWARYGIWLEQCMRDVLRIIWDIGDNTTALNERVPPNKQIYLCTHCCQQFFVSRETIHRRPLNVWQTLLHVLGNQTVCHVGEPDYANLYAFNRSSRWEVGPEPVDIHGKHIYSHIQSNGLFTQALTSEHLAHMIFGHHGLIMPFDQNEYCKQYLPSSQCPSPCNL